jgi:hypothetical protein
MVYTRCVGQSATNDDATVGFSLDLHDIVVEAAFIPSIAAVQYTSLTTPERANEGAGKWR